MVDVHMEIQVRYHEVDHSGIAYPPRYLSWFEVARLELLRGLGLAYPELLARGVQLSMRGFQTDFQGSLAFGDRFHLESWLERIDGPQLEFGYRVQARDEVVVTGTTRHGLLDAQGTKLEALPDFLAKALARLPSQGGSCRIEGTDPSETRLEQASP